MTPNRLFHHRLQFACIIERRCWDNWRLERQSTTQLWPAINRSSADNVLPHATSNRNKYIESSNRYCITSNSITPECGREAKFSKVIECSSTKKTNVWEINAKTIEIKLFWLRLSYYFCFVCAAESNEMNWFQVEMSIRSSSSSRHCGHQAPHSLNVLSVRRIL